MKHKLVKCLVFLSILAATPVTAKATTVHIEKGSVVNATDKAVYIRKCANKDSDRIGKLKPNSGAVKTGKELGNWIEVTSGEIQGYVNKNDVIEGKQLQDYISDNLKDFDVEVVTKKVTGQYLTKKNLKGDILDYEKKGTLQKDGIKLYKTAKLSDKQTATQEKQFVLVTEDGTRVRSKASIEDSVIYGLINKGDEFAYLGEENGFYHIKVDGKEAYVRNDCAKVITKDVPLNNVAAVDYIVNAMYDIENKGNDITKITIKGKDYYVSTDDVYSVYLKNTECKAVNIVDKEQTYDLADVGKSTYKVEISNPDSNTTINMYMPKDSCYLYASFEEADEFEEVKHNSDATDLSKVSDTTKSIYKDKYNYTWDNSSTDERNEIINYACQFLGNPYRYGGTSLTNGIDCSAFCMRVYQHFGISIGRDSNTQYTESRGKKIKAKDIQPGDLIYYSSNGGESTYHVVMYLGDGKVINASCRKYGICISNINYDDICAIKNYID